MTAIGFVLMVLASGSIKLYEQDNPEKIPGFFYIVFLGGITLLCGGISIWLWKHMP